MSIGSQGLGTAAALDSIGRFVANVGVPAAITFFMLSQITPRLDAIAANQSQTNTQLAIFSASCGSRPAIANLPPSSLDLVPLRRGGNSGRVDNRYAVLRATYHRAHSFRQMDRRRR